MYECHITIEPVFDDRLEQAKTIAAAYGFKVADLMIKRREQSSAERSEYDTFMTGHHVSYLMIRVKMNAIINKLKDGGFSVWRYKIEKNNYR